MSNINLLSGTAIRTEKGFFYIKNTVRVHIPNRRVLDSWRFYKVVNLSEASVAHYPIVGKLGFRDGTLLWCIANARYYIISNNKRLPVQDPDVLRNHGLGFRDAIIVSKKDLELNAEAVK